MLHFYILHAVIYAQRCVTRSLSQFRKHFLLLSSLSSDMLENDEKYNRKRFNK